MNPFRKIHHDLLYTLGYSKQPHWWTRFWLNIRFIVGSKVLYKMLSFYQEPKAIQTKLGILRYSKEFEEFVIVLEDGSVERREFTKGRWKLYESR